MLDEEALASWYGPVAAATAADWPEGPGWTLQELAALAREPTTLDLLATARVLDAPERAAGALWVRMPLRERRHAADIEVIVDPAVRGRGVGRALLARAEELSAAHGRTRLTGATEAALGSVEAERAPRFARAAGYEPALGEARRVLRLPVDGARLAALEAATAPSAACYDIRTWTGPWPVELEAGRVELGRSMSTDAPQDEPDAEPEHWDADRLRAFERTVAAMGRELVVAAAVAQDGALAGFSEISVPRVDPRYAYQLDTIVAAPHRGHRLGMALKLANLRALGRRSPPPERVLTWNATANLPMVKVNDELGFRVVGLATTWARSLG